MADSVKDLKDSALWKREMLEQWHATLLGHAPALEPLARAHVRRAMATGDVDPALRATAEHLLVIDLLRLYRVGIDLSLYAGGLIAAEVVTRPPEEPEAPSPTLLSTKRAEAARS